MPGAVRATARRRRSSGARWRGAASRSSMAEATSVSWASWRTPPSPAGGRVIGVLPRFLMDREVGHSGLSELHLVDSMHERKAKMAELSDAFVALPGGLGTLEEIFEAWTWVVLGLQQKPCGLLDRRQLLRAPARVPRSRRGGGFRELRPSRAPQGGERPSRAAREARERRAATCAETGRRREPPLNPGKRTAALLHSGG